MASCKISHWLGSRKASLLQTNTALVLRFCCFTSMTQRLASGFNPAFPVRCQLAVEMFPWMCQTIKYRIDPCRTAQWKRFKCFWNGSELSLIKNSCTLLKIWFLGRIPANLSNCSTNCSRKRGQVFSQNYCWWQQISVASRRFAESHL